MDRRKFIKLTLFGGVFLLTPAGLLSKMIPDRGNGGRRLVRGRYEFRECERGCGFKNVLIESSSQSLVCPGTNQESIQHYHTAARHVNFPQLSYPPPGVVAPVNDCGARLILYQECDHWYLDKKRGLMIPCILNAWHEGPHTWWGPNPKNHGGLLHVGYWDDDRDLLDWRGGSWVKKIDLTGRWGPK